MPVLLLYTMLLVGQEDSTLVSRGLSNKKIEINFNSDCEFNSGRHMGGCLNASFILEHRDAFE